MKLKDDSNVTLWLSLLVFLGLISPTIINYTPYGLSWDPAYYLHNAVCMNHAVYDFSLTRVAECLSKTSKGPIMELFSLPWGRTGGTFWGIGLAFVGLALFIWIMVLATYLTCMRGGIPITPLLLGAASIYLTPFLRVTGGGMMTDMLLAWCIALALMLIPLEYNDPQTTLWPSVLRGLLWGFVIDVGMLSKVTFAFFFGVIGIALLGIRWWRSGMRPLFYALAGCVVGAIPAAMVWSIYGGNFLRFAVMAAWGNLSHLFNVPGMTAGGYIYRYFSDLNVALIPVVLLLILFVRGLLIEKQGRFVRLFPIGIVLVYLMIAARSQNRDPRFTMPVMIALPLGLAWTKSKRASETVVGVTPVLAALIAGMLFAIPMVGRPEIAPIERTGQLLKTLSQGRPIGVIVATDGGLFNIETVELARQIGGETLRPVRVDTLVYDEVNKRTLEDGLKRIDKADYVLFLKPEHTPGPDWSQMRARDYRAYCEKTGHIMDVQTSPDFDVFKIH